MRVLGRVKQTTRAAVAALRGDDVTRIWLSGFFDAKDIGWLCDTYYGRSALGTPWTALRDSHLRLPGWFRHGLDPLSDAYAAQQERLWKLISGVERDYDVEVDEKEHDWSHVDPVRTPGFYARRDEQAIPTAAAHIIASGMLLKHCRLKAGDWALEYGAGFGQSALTLARLGVNVDTVDVSTVFCDFVRRQADYFAVPLTPFQGLFGFEPRPGKRYQLIWFYECFHHCKDFLQVVHRLRDLLAEGGQIIIGGEPIVERKGAAVPYPWGIRLHAEVVAVVRNHHWFELGFSEQFLYNVFINAGFVARRVDCPQSELGVLYVFSRRLAEIDLAGQWIPSELAGEWSGQQDDGLLMAAESSWPVDATESFDAIEIDVARIGRGGLQLVVQYGKAVQEVQLPAGRQVATVRFAAEHGARHLRLSIKPGRRGRLARLMRLGQLHGHGVVLQRLRYLRS